MKPLEIALKGVAYLFTGVTLIIGSLFALGYILDELVQIYPDSMPVPISLLPLMLMVVGIGWGGYLIWKSTPAAAVIELAIERIADKLVLKRVSNKTKMLVGTPLVLSGMVMAVVSIARTAIRIGFGSVPLAFVTPLVLIGIGVMLLGLLITHDVPSPRRKYLIRR